MLVYMLLNIPLLIIGSLTQFFPEATTLPMGLDTILTMGINNTYFVMDVIPPLRAMYDAFLLILAWKVGLRLFKLIPVLHRIIP